MDNKINSKKSNYNQIKLKTTKKFRRNNSNVQIRYAINAKDKSDDKQIFIKTNKTPTREKKGKFTKVKFIGPNNKAKRYNENSGDEIMLNAEGTWCEDSTNLDIFFDKLKKEFSDVGNIINLTFNVGEKLKLNISKSEYVILKVIENEIAENNKVKIKEFICNNKKLNVFKTLKSNNLEDKSIIDVILE